MVQFNLPQNSKIEVGKYFKDKTICIIGVLTLAAKLCQADGHFSIVEEEEILKIIPHERDQKRILLRPNK